jgi:uncharacterized membrane protein (UPF0127 family)
MKKLLVYTGITVVFLAMLAAWLYESQVFHPQEDSSAALSTSTEVAAMRTIRLDGNTLYVEVADTEAAREQGLGGHSPLSGDQGMLFVFQKDGVYPFWMKGMTFSLDIIWLSSDGTITYIVQNIPPETYPHSFGPQTPARYVLELNAGYARTHGVKVGDKAQL